MGRNWDEPFSLYGLLAESIEVGPEREWVEFTLRPEARFSDGSPVTVEDVIWSMETLTEKGLPRYPTAWSKVAGVEAVRRAVGALHLQRAPTRELPLIIGLRPILKKADWEGVDFAAVEPAGSGGLGALPDRRVRAGPVRQLRARSGLLGRRPAVQPRAAQLRRDPLRIFRRRRACCFQAFTAGELSVYRETDPQRWAADYGFPAVTSGAVVKAEIPHGRPSGMEGFVFNTRRPLFQDWRVREALIQAFNFEFVNRTLNGGVYPRRASYFANSRSGDGRGAGRGAGARRCWSPSPTTLPPDALDGYALPVVGRVAAQPRQHAQRARRCWRRRAGRSRAGRCATRPGEPFAFKILLQHGPDTMSRARSRRQHLSSTRCASSASTATVQAGRPGAVQRAAQRLRLRHDRRGLEHVAVARATSRRSTGARRA